MKLASTLLTCVLTCAAPAVALAAPIGFHMPPVGIEAPLAPAPAPAPAAPWALSSSELDELAQAEAQSADLEALHGGEITNDDLITILIVVAIVVLIAVIV